MVDGTATVSSDSGFETTPLTIDVTKMDSSIEGSMGVTILFGEVRCDSRRPYLVCQGNGDSAKLFQGTEALTTSSAHPSPLHPSSRRYRQGSFSRGRARESRLAGVQDARHSRGGVPTPVP